MLRALPSLGSRLCSLGAALDPSCFLPPSAFQQSGRAPGRLLQARHNSDWTLHTKGSRTLTITPFTATGRGAGLATEAVSRVSGPLASKA